MFTYIRTKDNDQEFSGGWHCKEKGDNEEYIWHSLFHGRSACWGGQIAFRGCVVVTKGLSSWMEEQTGVSLAGWLARPAESGAYKHVRPKTVDSAPWLRNQ